MIQLSRLLGYGYTHFVFKIGVCGKVENRVANVDSLQEDRVHEIPYSNTTIQRPGEELEGIVRV